MNNFHSSIPHFGEMEFDFREVWSFSCHSHFQPLSAADLFSFILVLYLNPVSHCCCCIGWIPTSFIIRSSPHTHPSLLFPPRCHLPSILNMLLWGVGKTATTDGDFRICPVVTQTAIITDWGFTWENISGRRDILIKCKIPECHIFIVVTPTWNWCLIINITLPLWFILFQWIFVLLHFYKIFILANTSRKKNTTNFYTFISSFMSSLLLCSLMS